MSSCLDCVVPGEQIVFLLHDFMWACMLAVLLYRRLHAHMITRVHACPCVQVMLPVTMLVEWLTGDSSFVDLFEPVVVFKVGNPAPYCCRTRL